MKDVKATASKLGMKPDVSYLWDDNEVQSEPIWHIQDSQGQILALAFR